MKILLFCVAGLLLVLGGGFAWHLHSPLPFLSSSPENSELPADASTDSETSEAEMPALPNAESVEEDGAGDKNGKIAADGEGSGDEAPVVGDEANDFSIEIISGMGENSETSAD